MGRNLPGRTTKLRAGSTTGHTAGSIGADEDPARLPDVPGAGRSGPWRVRAQPRRAAGRARPRRSSAPCSTAAAWASRSTSGWRARRASAARRFDPDVVYAHFLFPTGLIGAIAGRAPLVVTAHGRDVRNVGWLPESAPRRGSSRGARPRSSRSPTIYAASSRQKCRRREGRPRWSTRVSTSSASPSNLRPRARRAIVCIASLIERKNVLRLARAFERLGTGTLTFVGVGPLRAELEGRPGIELSARCRTTRFRRRSPPPTSSASRA